MGRSSATECREGCTVGLWLTKKIPVAGGAPVGGFGRDGSSPQRGTPPSPTAWERPPPYRPRDAGVAPSPASTRMPEATTSCSSGPSRWRSWWHACRRRSTTRTPVSVAPLSRRAAFLFDPHTDFDRISERALPRAPRTFGYWGVLRTGGRQEDRHGQGPQRGNLRAARPHRVPVGDRQARAQRPQDVVPDRQGCDALRGTCGANHREPQIPEQPQKAP